MAVHSHAHSNAYSDPVVYSDANAYTNTRSDSCPFPGRNAHRGTHPNRAGGCIHTTGGIRAARSVHAGPAARSYP